MHAEENRETVPLPRISQSLGKATVAAEVDVLRQVYVAGQTPPVGSTAPGGSPVTLDVATASVAAAGSRARAGDHMTVYVNPD